MYASSLGGPSVRWLTLPAGEAGTWATIAAMRGIVAQGARSLIVQTTARAIMAGNPVALRQWLAAHFRFRSDPDAYEAIWTPADQLGQIQRRGYALGDCDDAAVLGAALARAAGLSVQFVLLGFERGPMIPLTHVYAVAAGVELDVTKPNQPVAPATRRVTVEA